MPRTRTQAPFALALLAATCLTPIAPAAAAPGDALGPEFQVNSYTTGSQSSPAVAMDADGDFVVAWSSFGQDGDASGIFAQRFNAAGGSLGPEFRVNSTTVPWQKDPSVAMDADGDFVVAWTSGEISGETYAFDIFAQRYGAAGAPLGGEVRVSTATDYWHGSPNVAMDADGDFVVAWEARRGSYIIGITDAVVFARRYSAAGEPQGDAFRVSATSTDKQWLPSIAMDSDGDFVVAWERTNEPDSRKWFADIFARRFDASGAPQGPESRVNTYTTSSQTRPAVAMDADGDFVVAWNSDGQDGGSPGAYYSYGVFAQRFAASGLALSGEFQVNTTIDYDQANPSVTMDADGDFVVAWHSVDYLGSVQPAFSDAAVFAQRYDATGVAQGGEFQVNSFTTGSQGRPAVVMDADGDFVVAWASVAYASYGQDGDGSGVFAQRFDGAERVAGDFDGDGKADLLWRNVATGAAVVWLMDGETRLEAGSVGTVPTAWEIAGTGDFNGDGKADILWRHTGNGTAVLWQMNGLEKAAAQSIGAPPLAWNIEQLRDTNGDGLTDIVWRNTGTGATVVWRMSGFTRVAAEPIGSVASDWQLR